MQLRIENLSKTYPNGTQALTDVSLTIESGMFGLLGPNGAGKSSLMRTISTLQQPSSGEVWLGDTEVTSDPTRIRQQLGYLPQEFGVYKGVSAQDLLDHLAVLKGIQPRKTRRELVDYLLDRVNLTDHRKKAVSGYSGGMRQRFGIAQALIGDPNLVIVDEPTAGLDPGERNRFYNLLSEIGEQKIVILSTHIVQDVEQLCRRFAIINQGQVRFVGGPAEAKVTLANRVYAVDVPKEELESFRRQYEILSERLVMGTPRLHVLADVHPGGGFQVVEPDLEDFYFSTLAQHTQPV